MGVLVRARAQFVKRWFRNWDVWGVLVRGAGTLIACRLTLRCGAAQTLTIFLSTFHSSEADRLAHDVYRPNSPVLKELADAFGSHLIQEDGNLNRGELGKVVFGNPQALQKLERIVWPHVQTLVQTRIQELKDSYEPQEDKLPVIVVEAAVMLDAGWHTFQDGLWVITVAPEVALARLEKFRNMPRDEALQRIEAQKPRRGMDNLQEEIESGLVSAVVENSGNTEDLKRILLEKLNDDKAWYPKKVGKSARNNDEAYRKVL